MNDYTVIVILAIILIISLLIKKNDFKNWNGLDLNDKFYAIRVPFITIFGIILFLLKIITS